MKHLSHKKILLASIQPWNSPLISKHFLTLEFTKLQSNITFVNTQRTLKILFPGGNNTAFTFHDLMPDTLTLIQLYLSPRVTKVRLLRSTIRKLVRRTLGPNYSPDIVISFDPIFYPIHETYPNALKIYYCADFLAGTKLMAAAEERLLSVSDLVIVASRRLFEHLRTKHSCVNYVPHGVSLLDEYQDEALQKRIDDWFETFQNRTVLGFVGNINRNVDFDLIAYVARKHSDFAITLVGSHATSVEHIVKSLPPNVYRLGPVPTIGIKYCLEHFDVGLVPYVSSKFASMSHPIKVLQYIAAGLPVVCTRVGEDFKGSGFVYECGSHDEFERHVRLACEENSAYLRMERIAYAREHSWKRRVQEIHRVIERFLGV